MDRKKLTSELTKKFSEYMHRKYKTRAVYNKSAIEMKMLSAMLDSMNVYDKEEFLKGFAMSISRRIYYPFRPGSREDNVSLATQVATICHEHAHVLQRRASGVVKWYTRYVTMPAERARYEAKAYRITMEMRHYLGETYLSPQYFANKLTLYGCRTEDIMVACKMLESYSKIIQKGGYSSDITKTAIEWFESHA